MSRVILIHWAAAEAEERIAALRKASTSAHFPKSTIKNGDFVRQNISGASEEPAHK